MIRLVCAVDLVALCRRHLRQHFGSLKAVRVPALFRRLDDERHPCLFHVPVIGHDVQATTRAVSLVDAANNRQDIGHRWAVTRFVRSHARRIAQ